MARFVRTLGILGFVVLLPVAALAQATITGTVKDTSGAVLPGVTVEVASPVLIEKVRSAVTDGSGRFQIVDLRPGAYTVTFTLAGFNTTKRDGVTLSGSGVQTVDADLRVGALEETITVTGEAPVVDTQSLTKQQVLNSELVDSLPTARNYFGLARMIPGTTGGGNDVGGSLIQDVGQSVTVHGSRNTDQRVTANGVNTMTLQAGGNIGGQTPDLGSAAEVTVDTTSLGADLPTGGIRINFVPKDGGNRFSDSAFFSMSNESLQGDNLSKELVAAGFSAPNKIINNYDLNEALGGPFKRDKVWFWFSTRINTNKNYAPVFNNLNAFNPNEWLYRPSTEQAVAKGQQYNNSIRVTYQATPKIKMAGTLKADKWCNCPSDITATRAPEAGRDRRFPRLRQEHGEITSPLTNKLLFEAVGMHLFERWGDMHLRVNGGSLDDAAKEAIIPQMISVTEQSSGLVYRGRATNNNTLVPSWTYRAAVSYVTGSHAFKTGFNNTTGFLNEYQYASNPLSYRFNNGVPNQVTLQARPYRSITDQQADLGFFAQDRWSLNRMTVNLAIRYDYFATGFPEQTLGATTFTPTRNITFPAADNLSWKDVSYRSGMAYDLFGNGRTALKVAFNKYLLGQTLNGIGRNPNPVLALATSTTRSWTDNDRDFVVDCDLVNPLAQSPATGTVDSCGAFSDSSFGTTRPGDLYDKDLTTGFGHRPANWEFSTSVQHELMRGVAVDVGYFRRIWKNFQVTDNLLVEASDYTYFNLVAPTDSRLGDASGTTITGLRNVSTAKFGQTQNYNTLSDKFGKQIDHWNGFDVSINARLQQGASFQFGISSGKQIEDDCEVVAKLPELNSGANMRPLGYCHREEPMMTQIKGYGVYTVPKVDVQVSGTFRSIPGAAINANYTATQAYLNANSTLGRPLSGGAANISVALLPENTKYLDRRQELDMRFGKVLRFGRTKSVVSLDVFNFLNSDARITVNNSYAAWLTPTSILNARLMKFSVQFDF
ncbi:MAG: carboxypeptidase regulatory-like domain-containing protein [Vicinamibacterales bacterium]